MSVGLAERTVPDSDLLQSGRAAQRPVPAALTRLFLAGCGLLVPLLLLELVLRLLGPVLPGDYQTAAFTAASPLVGRMNRPNTSGWRRTAEFTTWVRVNSHGLRGPEIDYARPPGMTRVMVLGDSFTFAMQVAEDETLVQRLAARLGQTSPATPIETINAGVDGWSTANEYAWFTSEGYRYAPDLVILMFYVGNDPGDNADQVQSVERLNRLDQLQLGGPAVDSLAGPRDGLRRVSLVYNMFEQGVLAKISPPVLDDTADVVKQAKAERRQDVERKQQGWVISEALIARLRDAVAARGGRLLVVGIPTSGQVTDPERARTPIADIASRLGVPGLDLLDTFRAQPRRLRDRLYFPENGHWTPDGHAIATQAVADEIDRLHLLQPS